MDCSLDDYVKQNKIGKRGGAAGKAFYNKGQAKDNKTVPSRRGNRGGSKMPSRSPAKRGGNVGKRSTRGTRGTRGGASRGGRGARTNLSTQEAQKRLIQAKRTLQAAIQAASQITQTTTIGRLDGSRKARNSYNDRYLDRVAENNSSSNGGGNFYNGGNWRGRAGPRGRSRGGRGGRGRGRY